jgi:polyhydroxyalkanoate synthase subunit PhaC
MLAASDAAPQHRLRPLPLFLDLVQEVAGSDPATMERILAGVRRYETAPRPVSTPVPKRQFGPMSGWLAGESGPVVVLIPSLINPAWIMDLDADRSLLRWLGAHGFRAILLDWAAVDHGGMDRDLSDHVSGLLVPAVEAIGEPVHAVGYCLGGLFAAGLATALNLRSLTLVATPWHFDGYDSQARAKLAQLWHTQQPAISALGTLPVELLQAAFWNLDRERTVHKFARLSDLANDDADLAAFVRLEDWANDGAPLTVAAGKDLFVSLFQEDRVACGQWHVAGRAVSADALSCPAHQFVAADDRIVPASSACDSIKASYCASGHVGMMVGSRARQNFWEPLQDWLSQH